MRRAASIAVVGIYLAAGLGAGVSAAADPVCPGPVLMPHPLGPGVSFETNSRLSATGQFPLFEDCVLDRDPSEPVRVNWYATSIHDVWAVPGGPPIQMPRVPTDDPKRARAIDSCIGYGLVGQTSKAILLGYPADVAKDSEHRGCEAAASKPGLIDRIIRKLAPVVYKFVFAAPSDGKSPQRSLVLIEGAVRLQPQDEKTYSGAIYFELSAKGQSAKLIDIGLRPALLGDAERLTPALNQAFRGEPRSLAPNAPFDAKASKSAIEFKVSGGVDWELVPARFEVLDRYKSPVASIELPLLVPTR
jgi:hypothetical protein